MGGSAGPSPCAFSSTLCMSSLLALLLPQPRSRTQSSRARSSRPRCGLSSAGAHTQLSTCSQWLALADAALLSTSRLATASPTSSPSVALASSSTRSPMLSLPRRLSSHSEHHFDLSQSFTFCFLASPEVDASLWLVHPLIGNTEQI